LSIPAPLDRRGHETAFKDDPMRIMIKTMLLLLLAALAGLLIYASTKPDTFAVQRSTLVAASPERLHLLINDIRQLNRWSPYIAKDPKIVLTYRGPAAGPGAAFDFKGNQEVGQGSITILSTAPLHVGMRLDMLSPFEGHNLIDFTLEPQGAHTKVTWAMHGPSPYISKVMGVIFNMDQMIGRDFEAGLAKLKALAEAP
jgi:Polyketide cyclase / dehydrase and lipid transport